MTQTINYSIEYGYAAYNQAINYDGTKYYHSPVTINIDGKVFILQCGTTDHISVKIDGNTVFIVGENQRLDYISMSVIDLNDNSFRSCYLSSNDINDKDGMAYDIFELDIDKQIAVLENYFPY